MCSYCGCQSIDSVGRFMQEHEEIVNLTGPLHRAVAARDDAAISAALDHLVAHLHPHTDAEEAGLFTVLRGKPGFTAYVDGLCAEHALLDGLAERIRAGEHDVVDEFVNQLRSHIDKEENGLFPAAAIELDGPDWVQVDRLTPSRAAHAH
ncbi:hemerythrin domain-containing protein [Intrasporangium mesophilum]